MSVRIRTLLLFGALVAAWFGGYLAAELKPPSPIVELRPVPEATTRTPRGGRLAPAALAPAGGPAANATGAAATDPAAPPANGGGGAGRASGCVTDPPGPSFNCQNGAWVMTNSAGAAPGAAPSSSSAPAATPPGSAPPSSGGAACTPPAPGDGYRCENGVWVIRSG